MSRIEYLDRILDTLKKQIYKSQSLIVIFDGPDEQYLEVRNKVVGMPYKQVLCVPSNNTRPAFAITERREHIANIHNQARQLIVNADWIFSVEDDGILPPDALSRLVKVVKSQKDVGLVTGVELGRWGVPYVGAWYIDDLYRPTKAQSLENHAGEDFIEEIDGCGLYCALIRADLYKTHEFDSRNGLGPDVNLALYVKHCGWKNYIDWGIPVTHLTNDHGIEKEIPATSESQIVVLTLLGNNLWHQAKFPTGQPPFLHL